MKVRQPRIDLFSGETIKSLDQLQIFIPVGLSLIEDMTVRLYRDVAIKTTGWYDEQRLIHLKIGKRGTALGTEALDVTTGFEVMGADKLFTSKPTQFGCF